MRRNFDECQLKAQTISTTMLLASDGFMADKGGCVAGIADQCQSLYWIDFGAGVPAWSRKVPMKCVSGPGLLHQSS